MTHPTDAELEAMAVNLVFFHPGETSELAAAMLRACKGRVSVDGLAQIIRTVDGSNSLGAGALAEAILAALEPAPDALEAAEMSAKHWHARAKAAEAERDALRAELADAVGALQKIESRPDKMTWGEDYEVSEAMRDMEETARAFIARHQKGADT